MKKLILLSLILISCDQKKITQDPARPSLLSTHFLAETAINTLSSVMDEQTGEALGYIGVAETCARAISRSCEGPTSGSGAAAKRSLTYDNCTINNKSYRGTIEMQYSTSDCSFSTDGATVTRAFASYLYGAHDGVLVNSSENTPDYLNQRYGGGSRLTRVSAGSYNIDILGRRSQVLIQGYLSADVSIRTISPVLVSQGLSRSNRQLDGGVIEVYHNQYTFKATMNLMGIKYSSSCCAPVSGVVNVSYSGKREGTSVLTFTSCGHGTISEDGATSEFLMTYCE